MKYAICYLAVGQEAQELLALSIKSLYASGYEGAVHVLCDKRYLNEDIGGIMWNEIKPEHLNLDPDKQGDLAVCDVRRLNMKNHRNRKMSRKFTICHAKTILGEYVPFNQYDYVVYLDVDILVQGSLSKFENYLQTHSGSIITASSRMSSLGGNRWYLSTRWFRPNTITTNLTTWELFKFWHRKPLCADIVCIPTTDLGKEFLELWQKECLKGIDSDQAALQAVLLRHYDEYHVLAPYNIFGYGRDNHQYASGKAQQKIDSIFVHFNGALVDQGAMREYYQKYIVK